MDANSMLKNARSAIDAGEFNIAVEICKEVLKNNKRNYMALLFAGVALQDNREAVKYFMKAIAEKPTNMLAYQGLVKFYENNGNTDDTPILLKIYVKIYKLNGFDLSVLLQNVVNLISRTKDWTMCANMLLDLHIEEKDAKKKQFLANEVINLVMNYGCASEDALNLFARILEMFDINLLPESCIFKYFSSIITCKGYSHAFHVFFDVLQKVIVQYNYVDWLLKLFPIVVILNLDTIHNTDKIEVIYNNYVSIYPNAEISILNKAVFEYVNNKPLNGYMTAMNIFWNTKLYKDLIMMFNARCCIDLCRWLEAENNARTFIRSKDNNYSNSAKKILLTALAYQPAPAKCNEALEISKRIAKHLEEPEFVALFHAYINLNLLSEAEEFLNDKLSASKQYVSLAAKLKGDEAVKILTNDKENVHSLLHLGIAYFKNAEYKNAFPLLLKSAKFHPNNYILFLYLGDIYFTQENNAVKAKKCYLKSMELNPECMDAGKKLIKVYTLLNDNDSKVTLLNSIANSDTHINGYQSAWAWLELGLHHMICEEWESAVVNLRTYIRLDSSDVTAWVTLADAYYYRGSYTSALKCYKKALDINPDKKQCAIQIGTIQCLLGQFQEALLTFEEISDDEYKLPILKGQAEVKLCIASKEFEEKLYARSRDTAQDAINIICRAIKLKSNFVSLWRILYHAFLAIVKLPTKCRWIELEINNGNQQKFYGEGIYEFTAECIEKAISLSDSQSYLYHEKAVVYYDYYVMTEKSKYASRAYKAIVKCLEIDNFKWQYWNTMGIICSSEAFKKYSLAQHSFMKALEYDSSNAIIWSNLAILYSIVGYDILANKLLRKAQESNPTFVQCWIGQALLAENYAENEAADLFRHSTQLGFHKENSSRYAYWVIMNDQEDKFDAMYSLEKMHTIPAACDLAATFCLFEEENAWGLTLYGILLEKMGYLNAALQSFLKALKYVKEEYKNYVLMNLVRLYSRIKYCDSALFHYNNMSRVTAPTLALRLTCMNDLKKAYRLHANYILGKKFVGKDLEHALISMAYIAYKEKCYDDSKGILLQQLHNYEALTYSDDIAAIDEEEEDDEEIFEPEIDEDEAEKLWWDDDSSEKHITNEDDQNDVEIENDTSDQNEKSCIDSLRAYISVCLISNDFSNAEMAIELLMGESMAEEHNYIFFKTCLLYKRDSPASARMYLSNFIHRMPNDFRLWKLMSSISKDNVKVVNISTRKVLNFGKIIENQTSLKSAIASELILGNVRESKVIAQKAIRLEPNDGDYWAMLIRALQADVATKNVMTVNFIKKVASNVLHYCYMDENSKTFLKTLIPRE